MCNKVNLKVITITNNEFVNQTCLNGKKCKKLKIINIGNDTTYLCLKHGKSIITILIDNINFKCQSE